MNLSLLCKWLWKIERELWEQIITHKYLRKDTFALLNTSRLTPLFGLMC
jgi:hypothetical protein